MITHQRDYTEKVHYRANSLLAIYKDAVLWLYTHTQFTDLEKIITFPGGTSCTTDTHVANMIQI